MLQGVLLVLHLAFRQHRRDRRHGAGGRARSILRWCAALLRLLRHFFVALFFSHGGLLCEASNVTRYAAKGQPKTDGLGNIRSQVCVWRCKRVSRVMGEFCAIRAQVAMKPQEAGCGI